MKEKEKFRIPMLNTESRYDTALEGPFKRACQYNEA